ncbi:hypothetical protein L6164_033416 [Bauhinia variegata]|uniref:Uncharacterized protein n=1 Tax=Bauhinia variegata TaxID=167791 RepID=A0ACB9KRQ9_BAUVA|nr:hypothetical protein L6164_033416 [Bauhinia variegata]
MVLLKAGKEVLINAVALSIPTYTIMSCFRLSKSFRQEMNQLMARFWWGQTNEERKIYWLCWEKLSKPKCWGVLGFRNLEDFNIALLAKQVWRILQKPESLVAIILKAKYFPTTNILDANMGSKPSYT